MRATFRLLCVLLLFGAGGPANTQQPATVAPWPCPQEADVDGDSQPDTLVLKPEGAVLRTAKKDLNFDLPAPAVVRACLGDLEGTKKADVLVEVVHSNPKDSGFRKRLFIYRVENGWLRPRFLGTGGPDALLDLGVADLDGDGKIEVLARERAPEGPLTRVYRWQGFGLVEDKQLQDRAPPYQAAAIPLAPPAFQRGDPGKPAFEKQQPSFDRSKAKARQVRVAANLGNVANAASFRSLPAKARAHLAQHGFVVVRPQEAPPEFHDVYLENLYEKLPSFVSADAALHMTHLLLDRTVQEIEEDVLGPALIRLLEDMRARGKALAGALPAAMKPALGSVLFLLDVGVGLLGGETDGPDGKAQPQVQAEVRAIEGQERGGGNPFGLDYGDFRVRGHYTHSEALSRYFRAFLFLSQAKLRNPVEAALLAALANAAPESRRILSRLDSFGRALAGPAASNNVLALLPALERALGGKAAWADLAKAEAWKADVGEGVALLSRRVTSEGAVFDRTATGERLYPDPLDWMAALGSDRARELLKPEIAKHPELGETLSSLSKDFREGQLGDSESLLGRWLLLLRWVLLPYPAGYPAFMRSAAWPSHNLVTAGGSWAESRRDTILYVEPPMHWAEGGDERALPPSQAGYVEPVPELYRELHGMLSGFRAVAEDFAGPHGSEAVGRLKEEEELLGFLEKTAAKELTGSGLSAEEHDRLCHIGETFEGILVGSGKFTMDPVPVIADVFYFGDPETGVKKPLLVGTGPVDLIVVAVPLGNRVILARGAAYSFYHFVGERPWTDEEWRQSLEKAPLPEPPAWAAPTGLIPNPVRRHRAGD